MRNNKQLYNLIIHNVSKVVKRTLNEDILRFDVSEYEDDNDDVIVNHNLDDMVYDYCPKTKLELSRLITERVEKNPEEPFLLDINTSYITNMHGLFMHKKIKKLDLSTWNVANVTNMAWMFGECSSLVDIDLSGWNTLNVTDMSYMFYNCNSLKELDLSDFITFNVTNMQCMFDYCTSLYYLNLSNWNTRQVTNMSYMFRCCELLKQLNLTHFNTSNVTDMCSMFFSCYKLTSLNLSNFDTHKVDNMYSMFSGCKSLQELDLSNFDTSNTTKMWWMFRSCRLLKKLDLSSFEISPDAKIDDMFEDCKSLMEVYTKNKKIKEEFNKIKQKLLENVNNIHNFDVTDYEENDIISSLEIDTVIGPEHILLDKVLTGKYNSDQFTDKEIEIWNSKIAGKVIDKKGTVAITYIKPFNNFLAKLIDVKDICEVDDGKITTNGYTKEYPMALANDFTIKNVINIVPAILNSLQKFGKIALLHDCFKMFSDDIFYVGMIIDTDNYSITLVDRELFGKLGVNWKGLIPGVKLFIDESLSHLIDFDMVNMGIKKIKAVNYFYGLASEY